ncbi:MAG: sugar phosphate isomerase/epimerase [Bacteroidaceae bacterium]|nr:sugar phosphate isomerase/epimerase [Bacteroidaceae bacterium]
MKLGISSALEHTDPHDWALKHKRLGLECVNFPVDHTAGEEVFMAYKEAADEAGLMIAEVGVWRNTLARDPEERERWIRYAIGQLEMADRIGARCCVNVVGTPYGPRWDGGYRGNYSPELWKMAVDMIRRIIDSARPKHTKYSIESMPWMIPDSPDQYLRLIEDVDRDEFGAHLDVVNMITSPERYFFNELFIEECFEKLDGRICSCHLKDVLLKQEYTFQLEECACGQGTLDIGRYADLASAQDPDMPMIIEHLDTDSEYRDSVMYVRNRLLQLGDGGVPDGA